MKTIFSTLKTCLETEDAVLVTVVAGSGSTPRGAGATMVINASGRLAGTIGGGMVEYKSQLLALDLLKTKENHLKEFRLTPNQVEDLGMICGGDVNVYFRVFKARDSTMLTFLDLVIESFDLQENSWFIINLQNGQLGLYRKSLGSYGLTLTEEQQIRLFRNHSMQRDGIYVQPIHQSGKVVVFGGGHVAQELIPLLDHIGLSCVVFDDRPDFVTPELFPHANERILGDFHKIHEYVTLNPEDYAIVMTRGHAFDLFVQRQLHFVPLTYIGIIGSRTKMAKIFQQLRTEGVPEQELARIHTPIGLPIKAETPAEIAVSIAAELIQVRAEEKSRL